MAVPTKVRRWEKNGGRIAPCPLITAAKDGPDLEALIQANSERTVALAWWLYVNSEPPVYHLEPVEGVQEYTSKKGNKCVNSYADETKVTTFPLASFLKVPDGFIEEAEIILSSPEETARWEEWHRPIANLITGPW